METTRIKKEYRVNTEEELAGVASEILALHPGIRIFALYGAMGAGKTTCIKAFCAALSVRETVSSPSFPIVNHYRSEKGFNVYHFDFYRIESLEEVFDLGYEDYFYSGDHCFIEWPEKVEQLLPSTTVKIYMEDEAGSRTIRL